MAEVNESQSAGLGAQDGNALASLAILSIDVSKGNLSYFDHFVPFVVEALATGCGGRGTTQNVTDSLYEDFGLQFPPAVVRDILKRAGRRGLVVHHNNDNDFSISGGLESNNTTFRSQRTNALREQASLAQSLVNFSLSQFELIWTHEEAENALQDFIAQINTSRILQVLGISNNGGTQESQASEITQAFIVGEFITYIVEKDPVSFGSLENLVKGSMLAAALYLPGSLQTTKKFRGTTIWIDAPVALLWLGLDGEEAKNYVESMMALALQQGAKLGMFSHSLRELRSIVKSATDGISFIAPGTRPSQLTLRFRDEKVTYAQGIAIANSLESDLSNKGVVIEDAPDYEERYGIDEAQLEEILQAAVGYHSPGALRVDLSSILGVYQLRRGATSDCIEDCRAILITGNPNLAQGARRFFGRSGSIWPTVMVDHELASLLWSKSPLNAPNLPRNRIIADALTALQPSTALWSRYTQELDRLAETNKDLTGTILVLRNDSEARRILMQESLGDPERVTPEIIQTILKEITDSVSEPIKAQLTLKELALTSTAEELSKISRVHAEVLQENDNMKIRLDRMEAEANRRKERAIKSSTRWAFCVRNGLKLLSIILAVGAFLGLIQPKFGQEIVPLEFRTGVFWSSLSFVILTILFSLKGHSFFGVADRCGRRAMKFVQRSKFAKIGLDTASE